MLVRVVHVFGSKSHSSHLGQRVISTAAKVGASVGRGAGSRRSVKSSNEKNWVERGLTANGRQVYAFTYDVVYPTGSVTAKT